MKNPKDEFHHSLDVTDDEIEKYIPFILEDLWELGSMPEYVNRLVRQHIPPGSLKKVTDFGCGKGAVLIRLASEFTFDGTGIDIVPEFIISARTHALQNKVADRIKFINADITKVVVETHHQDLVIYGYDSGILGNVYETLLQLRKCLSGAGWVILEVAFTPNNKKLDEVLFERDVNRQVRDSGLHLRDKIIWDKKELKKVNDQNNQLIQARISTLIKMHPDKQQLFDQYMDNQLKECSALEEDMICSTWLLKAT